MKLKTVSAPMLKPPPALLLPRIMRGSVRPLLHRMLLDIGLYNLSAAVSHLPVPLPAGLLRKRDARPDYRALSQLHHA